MDIEVIKHEILNEFTVLSQLESKELQTIKYDKSNICESYELDVNNINPILINVDSKSSYWKEWKSIEQNVASFEFRRSPGRNMYYLVKNEYDDRNLGVIDINADFLSLGPRDSFIGWDKNQKIENNTHIANISICVPTRHFGYNLSGGKLLALLSISNRIVTDWKEKYGDDLVGITVTSLYGRGTMYNRLKHFNYVGKTAGQGTIQVGKNIYKKLRDVVEHFDGDIPYGRFTKGKNTRIQVIRRGCNLLNIDSKIFTTHGISRGIYFAELCENTKDYLCNRTDLPIYLDLSTDSLIQYWKDTWGTRRLNNLINRNELQIKKTFF